MTAPTIDHATAAHAAAMTRLEALELDDPELETDNAAPYDGCLDCIVREALDAAMPHLIALAAEQAAAGASS